MNYDELEHEKDIHKTNENAKPKKEETLTTNVRVFYWSYILKVHSGVCCA